MKTSHTDKFTSVVFTKPLQVLIPLGCFSVSKKQQTPLGCQTARSAFGYKHFFIHSFQLPVFYFVPHKDELSILVLHHIQALLLGQSNSWMILSCSLCRLTGGFSFPLLSVLCTYSVVGAKNKSTFPFPICKCQYIGMT